MVKKADYQEFSITPKDAKACVVVFHEVWGLVEHTKDVCKRVSKLGFASVAPALYRGYEGILTPEYLQKTMEGVWELSLEERRDRATVDKVLRGKGASRQVMEVAEVIYDPSFRNRLLDRALESVTKATSKFGDVATLGFCLGGGLSLKCAVRNQGLSAAVSFYGEPPTNEDLKSITIPILAIFANHDEIINSKVPEFVRSMLDEGKDLTLKTYPGTKHGFFNDARKEVYDAASASEAWDLTRWFLERKL